MNSASEPIHEDAKKHSVHLLVGDEASSPEKLEELKNLILVPCHGVYVGSENLLSDVLDDDSWALDEFQRKISIASTFLHHIESGIKAAQNDPSSLLIFSGGRTKTHQGIFSSEADGYLRVSELKNWFGNELISSRVALEEFARDSFENLLFSICRFKEVTGNYPEKIIVVGYEFKKRRFMELHRGAVRFPADRFEYIGDLDTPGGYSSERYSLMEQGELKYAYSQFTNDLYGCNSEILKSKRKRRSPVDDKIHGYAKTCPEISNLLEFCGPDLFPGPLPWKTS